MAKNAYAGTQGEVVFPDPKFVHTLFSTTKLAWLFAIVRVWLGYDWFSHGLEKLNNPAWMETGESLLGYWTRAVAIPDAPARPLISYGWYRDFLQMLIDSNSHVWFAKLVVWGEVLVGVGLIVGAFVGITAFFGALMNFNFMLAGSASTNPVLFIVAVFLMLGWKVAGYWGADRVLLPLLGTPWGRNAGNKPVAAAGAAD
jgi:thiosulfate dehydrogenase [quinone] large subunit